MVSATVTITFTWTDADDCNPFAPHCLADLSSKQAKFMQHALSLMKTDNPLCAQAVAMEQALLASNKVYYGTSDQNVTPAGVPSVLDHTQMTVTQQDSAGNDLLVNGLPVVINQHFDQGVVKVGMSGGDYTAAQFGLAMLHEAFHALGRNHIGETHDPYMTPPFTLSNNPPPGTSQATTCVDMSKINP
jgi:hypothetical protein